MQEYLDKYKAEGRKVLSDEEQKNIIFMDKSQRLNQLVKEINEFGENIDLPTINKTIEEAKKVVYR